MDSSDSSYPTFLGKCYLYTFLGVLLGTALEDWTKRASSRDAESKALYVMGQLFVGITILFVLERFVAPQFASEFQSTLPGLFFVAFYFGSQSTLLTNLQEMVHGEW